MVKQKSVDLNAVFSALADPTRRAIVAMLVKKDRAAGELAQPFEMSWPAVTKHLNVLEAAGLVRRERDGRTIRCHLVPGPLGDAVDWMERMQMFWNERFDSLESFLKQS